MDIAEIRKLVRVMRDHGIVELELQDRRGKIRLVRDGAARDGAQVAVPAPPAAAAATRDLVVTSPMVGTFYRGAGPDAAPFIAEGDLVEAGQVLCVIEAMKMVNEIAAETRATVRRILVANGAPVEYGAPLFVLDPA
jgi:acetyl-CoA carboxylase biotin carboxyl carrier protein